jgi:eukaryotic-like serine/threonine-protein kinase
VHRDLKPANIFLHRSGSGALVPKVVDFGISKIIGAPGDEPGLSLTRTGAMMGSPIYMSPEQAASDKSIDARSDVHALGVVMWECLVGKPPYVAQTFNTLIIEIVTAGRPLLRDAMPEAPASIEALLAKAFAREREARFANAGELAGAIEQELADLGITQTLDQRTTAELFFSKLASISKPGAVVLAARYVSKRKRAATEPAQLASLHGSVPVASSAMASTGHDSVLGAQTAPSEGGAPAPKRSLFPYVVVGGALAIVAGSEWYLAGQRATAQVMTPEVLAVDASAPAFPPVPPVVFDAGAKTVSPRPTKIVPRPSPSAKGDFRRGVSGDGF